jgi:hypothetical protein
VKILAAPPIHGRQTRAYLNFEVKDLRRPEVLELKGSNALFRRHAMNEFFRRATAVKL